MLIEKTLQTAHVKRKYGVILVLTPRRSSSGVDGWVKGYNFFFPNFGQWTKWNHGCLRFETLQFRCPFKGHIFDFFWGTLQAPTQHNWTFGGTFFAILIHFFDFFCYCKCYPIGVCDGTDEVFDWYCWVVWKDKVKREVYSCRWTLVVNCCFFLMKSAKTTKMMIFWFQKFEGFWQKPGM